MPDSPVDTVEAFRSRLLRREASAMRAVVRAYLEASAEIAARIKKLVDQIERSENQNLELNRLLSLQSQIENEIQQFSPEAARTVSAAQSAARELAVNQAAAIIGSFDRLPTAAIESIVGAFEQGGSLARLFNQIGVGLAADARRIITAGIASGEGVRSVGRKLRDSLGVGLNRAMTISRTEILNSYRAASLSTYRANSDVVDGWIWYASLGPRCCAFCTAMHGTKHRLDESLISHPNCRCVPLPIVEGIGPIQSGAAWLREQSEETQIEILGQANFRAIQAGEVKLSDFIGDGQQRSLKSILGREGAMRFYKRAA